ncbi:MAG: AraC family transcriptional regulator [Myxococcota bacterium]
MPSSHDRASRIGAPDSQRLSFEEGDPLSDTLRTVRLSGAVFFAWDVSWPFDMAVPDGSTFAPVILPGARQAVSYHFVTEGECWAGPLGGPAQRLSEGDIWVVPRGHAYVMASSESGCVGAKVQPEIMDFYAAMARGDLSFVVEGGGHGDTQTRVLCGFLGCDTGPFNPLLDCLPEMVRLPASEASELENLVAIATREARCPRPGGRAALIRVSELLFIEVLRRCLSEIAATEPGWLAGLHDPVVGHALVLLHRRPSAAWSVEALAREVGTSRSRLAEAFTLKVGLPPMRYLARWRLQIASMQLTETSSSVAEVARDVGYASEAAFSRAFKRTTGLSPAAWRRGVAAPPIV